MRVAARAASARIDHFGDQVDISNKLILFYDSTYMHYTMAYKSMVGLTATGLERASALCTLSASRALHINTNGIKKL